MQAYRCKACSRKFNEKSGSLFARLRFPAPVVVAAVFLLVQFPISASQVRMMLQHFFPNARLPSKRTLTRWVNRFSGGLVKLQKWLKPNFSRVWSVDELFANRHAHKSKRKPNPKYLYTILDSLRQVVACIVTSKRDAKSVERVVKEAIETAGFTPDIVSRDGCPIYEKAERRLRLKLKGCQWVEAHFRAVAIPTTQRVTRVTKRQGPVTRVRKKIIKVTQNHIERYHCTPRQRENAMRGVKTDASGTAYFQAASVAYNLFKPHEAHDERSPAEAAGWKPIDLSWRTLPEWV